MFHTGEKPNQCSHCEKAFISKGVLHQHMITHTEEKSYHCSHFEKTLHKSKLDRHMIQHKEKHTGEKTYYFNQCEESISENDKFTENIPVPGRRININTVIVNNPSSVKVLFTNICGLILGRTHINTFIVTEL